MSACLYRLATWMNTVPDPNEITAELACFIVRQALQGFCKLYAYYCEIALWPIVAKQTQRAADVKALC